HSSLGTQQGRSLRRPPHQAQGRRIHPPIPRPRRPLRPAGPALGERLGVGQQRPGNAAAEGNPGQRRELIEAELCWWATPKEKRPSSRELAAVFGCSAQTVCNIAKRSGAQIGHLPTQGKDGKTYRAKAIIAPTPHQRFGAVKDDLKDARGELPAKVLSP